MGTVGGGRGEQRGNGERRRQAGPGGCARHACRPTSRTFSGVRVPGLGAVQHPGGAARAGGVQGGCVRGWRRLKRLEDVLRSGVKVAAAVRSAGASRSTGGRCCGAFRAHGAAELSNLRRGRTSAGEQLHEKRRAATAGHHAGGGNRAGGQANTDAWERDHTRTGIRGACQLGETPRRESLHACREGDRCQRTVTEPPGGGA